MIDARESILASQTPSVTANATDKPTALALSTLAAAADLLRALEDIALAPSFPGGAWERGESRHRETSYLAEAMVVEMVGRCTHTPSRVLELEMACTWLVLAVLRQEVGDLRQRCVILQGLAEEVVPRWLRGGVETRVRHLERDVLEFEAIKADFRQRLTAVWQGFGEALGRNANVQASCFALAEAAAWLKAADNTLGRMGWLSRLSQAEEREEPSAQQDVGRRVLRYCYAEIRDRLFRFDEDLASLRRGYYAPHIRAVALLLAPPTERPSSPPASLIQRRLRVLLIVEPLPAVSAQATQSGERVLESYWTLGDGDRAAVEIALLLRDAAPEFVGIDVVAVGPPRIGPALRELLSLGLERVHCLVQEREEVTAEHAATRLAAQITPHGSFDLLLGAAPPANRLAALIAEALRVPLAGHAAKVAIEATATHAVIRLFNTSGNVVRERPLPALVLLEAGTPLRRFDIAGYLAGLSRRVRIITT